jgi:sporulation protein YlmC with PRC-barrel domain
VLIHSIIAAAALSTVSSFALAQTNPAPPVSPLAQSSADTGMRMANSAGMAVKFVTVKSADFTSSKLMGSYVYNNQNESLGEIEDLVIDNGKTISGVVVSIGGFLGLGETYVLLDPSTIVLNQKDGKWRAYVDTSKDTLKNAPKFAYNKKHG